MIVFKINCYTQEKMIKKREEFHEALIGSPAYQDSEIAVCDEDDTSFLLIIGKNNENNIKYNISVNRLTISKE